MQCGFLHRRSSIGPGPRPCTTKPAINPILSSRSRIATPPPVFLSPSPRPIIISRAATEDEIAAASPALIGEDAAKFEVEKQKASSWALFFGLLTGVLGLLYLVRPAWGSMMTKTRAMDVDLLRCCRFGFSQARGWRTTTCNWWSPSRPGAQRQRSF